MGFKEGDLAVYTDIKGNEHLVEIASNKKIDPVSQEYCYSLTYVKVLKMKSNEKAITLKSGVDMGIYSEMDVEPLILEAKNGQ